MMKETLDFEDIRPYHDNEVKDVLASLTTGNSFFRFVKMLFVSRDIIVSMEGPCKQ